MTDSNEHAQPTFEELVRVLAELFDGVTAGLPDRVEATPMSATLGILFTDCAGLLLAISTLLDQRLTRPASSLLRSLLESSIRLRYLTSLPNTKATRTMVTNTEQERPS